MSAFVSPAAWRQPHAIDPSDEPAPALFDDLVSGAVPLVVIRGLISDERLAQLRASIERRREHIRVTRYVNGALTVIGTYLAKHTAAPQRYFDEASDRTFALPGEVESLRRDVCADLERRLGLASLKSVEELALGAYAPAIVRFHADGVANPLHNDNIMRDAAGTGLTVAQLSCQLSCVSCLQACDAGGRLRIYRKVWSAADERFKIPRGLGYEREVVAGAEVISFAPSAGDVYVFNTTHYHEVDRVSGAERITMGFFFGCEAGGRHAIAWS